MFISSLGVIDWVLVVLYLVATVFLGVWGVRRRGGESFLLADRDLGMLAGVATISASKIGSGLLLAYVGYVYLWGIGAVWFIVGLAVGYAVFLFFASKLKRRADEKGYYTLSDYFLDRFGRKARTASAALVLIGYYLVLLIQLIGGAKILAELSGWGYEISLVVIAAVITTYVVAGGFRSVVRTDVIQYFSLMIILVVLAVVLGTSFEYEEQMWNVFAAGGKDIVSFFLMGCLFPFFLAELWQRVYACKNQKVVRNSLLASSGLYVALGILLTALALVIHAQIPDADPDMALVVGLQKLLPVGLVGLAMIAFFAAIVSSADTYLFTVTSVLLQDLLDVGRVGSVDEERLKNRFRWALAVNMLACTVVALFIPVLVKATILYVAFGVVVAVGVLASWFRKGLSEHALIGGFVVGVLALIVVAITKGVEPALAMASLGGSIVGQLLGGIVGMVMRQRKVGER